MKRKHTNTRVKSTIFDAQRGALKTNTNYKSFANNLHSDYNIYTRGEYYCSRKYHNVSTQLLYDACVVED